MSNATYRPEKAVQLARELVDIVTKQETHREALEALISAFASVAICHPCCAHAAAATARRMADLIENQVKAPAGATHIH